MAEEEFMSSDSIDEQIFAMTINSWSSHSLPDSRYLKTMVFPSLQSLSDLCCIRIAYLMWTRRDVTKKCSKEVLFDELVDVVLNDLKSLHLPEQLKSRILTHLKPAGKHLLSLLSLWLSNQLPENSQKWLSSDMLFECLILNADGLINQRKTAEKLLSSKMVYNVFAFRFACINFLEKEVLRLWSLVKEYFLNKIILEGDQANAFIAENGKRDNDLDDDEDLDDDDFKNIYVDLTGKYYSDYIRDYPTFENSFLCEPFPFTTEPYEVLFWIAFCLSNEKAISIQKIPHFLGNEVGLNGWYCFSAELAAFSGNVACFDYLKNFRNFNYCSVDILKKIFLSKEEDRKLPCFVFLFLLLNSEEKVQLLQEFPEKTFTQFLQWPLSLTFVENPERLWNLMNNKPKLLIFRAIFKILFSENILLHPLHESDCYLFNSGSIPIIPGMYSHEHLSELWVALWKISSNSPKFFLYYSWLIHYIGHSKGQEFRSNFVSSGLRDKLFQLFLSNGEAVLELFERENMKESLRSLVSKYMPQHFEVLDSQCISFIETQTERPEIIRKEMVKDRDRILSSRKRKYRRHNAVFPRHEKFLNYIKKCLVFFE